MKGNKNLLLGSSLLLLLQEVFQVAVLLGSVGQATGELSLFLLGFSKLGLLSSETSFSLTLHHIVYVPFQNHEQRVLNEMPHVSSFVFAAFPCQLLHVDFDIENTLERVGEGWG